MAKPRLDQALLRKVAKEAGWTEKSVREGISKKASRLRVSSEAALLIWADSLGISIGGKLGRQAAHVQQQVRDHLSPVAAKPAPRDGRRAAAPRVQKRGDGVRSSVNLLLRHPDLKARCANTLKGPPPYDPAVNQATIVLETYLRDVAGDDRCSASDLAAIVFKHEDPLIQMNTKKDVQNGYMHLTRGLFAVLRNPTHHGKGKARMSREEAISYCAFINALLDDIGTGERKAKPAQPAALKSNESAAAPSPTATSTP